MGDLPSVFFIWVFFHRHWRFTEQQGGNRLLFHSTTSIRSRFLRHLFGALHVRWLPRIFNGNTCIYQTATRWYLPLIDWLIDWLIDCWYNVCLLNELILGLTWKTGVFELASTVTFELQANRLTKCALIKTDVQMQWKRAFQKLLI